MNTKNISIGLSTTENVSIDLLVDAINSACLSANVDVCNIKTIGTKSSKMNNNAIWEVSELYKSSLRFFDEDTLKSVEHLFYKQANVLGKISVISDSASSAYLAGNKKGKFLNYKTKNKDVVVSVFEMG